MKAFIVYDHGTPTVTIRDGNKTIKTYVYKLDTTRYMKDILDPLNWHESNHKVTIPRNNKGALIIGSELWYAMNVYLNYLKNPDN